MMVVMIKSYLCVNLVSSIFIPNLIKISPARTDVINIHSDIPAFAFIILVPRYLVRIMMIMMRKSIL